MNRVIVTVLLLTASNIFMTFAWYYHLKMKAWPLMLAILASWGIAFFEYCLQVPANRFGHTSHGGPLSAPQLKVIQEALTLSIFAVFSLVVLKEKLRPQDIIAFTLIFAGVAVAMTGRGGTKPGSAHDAPPPRAGEPSPGH
ncbi:MAG: DMT family protein [Phycisphaerales bacterium]|nr:DMT family protein [Phycisphaerales bacterium]